jgi:glutamine cyclotransferase
MRYSALLRLLATLGAVLLAVGCGTGGASGTAAATDAPATVPVAATDAPATVPAAATDALPGQLAPNTPLASPAPYLGFRVLGSYPHDPQAFTQGLVYIGDDRFYEGTGLEGRSTLREIDLAAREPLRRIDLPADEFGEGVAVLGDRIFQLTWQDCVGYIYYRADFAQVGTFRMPIDERDGRCYEGWGLTTDGAQLILSDGTELLFFVDAAATERTGQLAITGEIRVADAGNPVPRLNELEYIRGEIFANIWQSELIARIDPATGRVNSYLDLTGLRDQLPPEEHGPVPPEVLNGIAYDAANDRLFVTGKLWPRIFQIEIVGELSWMLYLPIADKG